jgi:hypothetical protein
LKPDQFYLCAATKSILVDSSSLDQVCAISATDHLVLDIKQRPCNNREKLQFIDDLFYFEERLYIPEGHVRLGVLQARHDFPAAGHFGFNKMLELIYLDFWWPQMWKAIEEFVSSYNTYSRSKNPYHWPYRLLQPLPIPK